jgi:succinyl-diaminopimelate desuccinylase
MPLPATLHPMNATLDLLKALIARPSNTPDDAGCCALLMQHLEPLGFTAEYFNAEGVTNLWATLSRGDGPLFVFAGHTDVVPTGPLDQWTSDPFTPTERDGLLFGRGAADMKSGISAMVTATQRFVQNPDWAGTLAFLITSDEEGPATHGTQHAIAQLRARGVVPDYAIVGEASSNAALGDRIMVGRRGSLNGRLTVLGKQGHVAYPHKVENPVLRFGPVLAQLTSEVWDQGNADFPPTSFQISNIHAGTGATNVVPGSLEVVFNFRYCTESTADGLKARMHALLDAANLRYELDWALSGEPFLTRQGALTAAAGDAIAAENGRAPERFTGGGTSDARFIAPWGAQTIELGPVNDSIHKIDEHVCVADLAPLSRMYEGILDRLLRL